MKNDLPPPGYISLADADALISSKVTAAVQQMMSLMSEGKSEPSSEPSVDFARQMALALAEFTDQGSTRKRVAPAEMARREAAHEQLVALLEEYDQHDVEPEYRLKRKCVLDHGGSVGVALIEPLWIHPVSKKQIPQTILHFGIPNDAMEPINEAAQRVFELWSTSVGGIERKTERQRVTPRGVVIVEGAAPIRRDAAPVPSGEAGGSRPVKLTGRGDVGEVVEKRILGSIAAPAREINGRARG